jgi:ATP-dependent protease HslVU (ClpYQ) peptidase subunit
MTVIAAKIEGQAIRFAGDRQVTSGFRKHTGKEMELGKLCHINGMTIGSAGLKSESQWLFLFARNHAPTDATESAVAEFFLEFADWMKKKDDAFQPQNEYLIAYRDKLFRVYDSMSVFAVPQHAAIGSGQDFAVAAMHLGHDATQAAAVAAQLDIYCSGDIDTVVHPVLSGATVEARPEVK